MSVDKIKDIARHFSVPVSTAFLFIFTFRETYDFLIYEKAAITAQIIGMSAAASYITYLGPDRIVREGGPLLQLFKIKPGVIRSYIAGGIWAFLSFICFAVLINTDWDPQSPVTAFCYLIYGLQYLCATASLAFFVSIAASKKDSYSADVTGGDETKENKDE